MFQGDEANVLDRSVNAQKYNADIVVRITGDCPLLIVHFLIIC